MEKPPRTLACERCHKRRQKCEGRTAKLGCFGCRKAAQECCLISSKRVRGARGRYTSASEQLGTQYEGAKSQVLQPPSIPNPGSAEALSSESINEPEANPELALLFRSNCIDVGEDQPDPDHLIDRATQQYASKESLGVPNSTETQCTWYTSYILSHGPMHQPRGTLAPVRLDKGQISHSSTVGNVPFTRTTEPSERWPSQQVVLSLLQSYFDRFYGHFPVLDRALITKAVRENTISQTLLSSVLYVSVIHCDTGQIYRMGFATRIDAQTFFFRRASTAFDTDKTSDQTALMLAAFHLHFWFGDPTAYRDGHWWLATAIRFAQCLKYHRRPYDTGLAAASDRKRIWWCLFIRDRQVALSTGNPALIHDLEFDVDPLHAHDLADIASIPAKYLILQAGLCTAVSQMYFNHCSPARERLLKDADAFEVACSSIESNFERWEQNARQQGMLNQSSPLSLHLLICYNYYLINLLRRVQKFAKATDRIESTIKTAAGRVLHLVEDLLLQYKAEEFPMIIVSAILCAASTHFTDAETSQDGREAAWEKFRPFLLCLRQFEQVYLLAGWVRKLFTRIVRVDHPEDGGYPQDERNSVMPTNETQSDDDITISMAEHPNDPQNGGLANTLAAIDNNLTNHQDDLASFFTEQADFTFAELFSYFESVGCTTENPVLGWQNAEDVQSEIRREMCSPIEYNRERDL